ncbi:MAG: DUF1501 domain-containing protein [Planctomycetota bacterium]|nr:DUF1501 domain-containing protein [Planctomycetota bacterium]
MPKPSITTTVNRRQLLEASGLGFGACALNWMLRQELRAAEKPQTLHLKPRKPHFPARAKSVVMLLQNGGPSQMDLFDPKPALTAGAGRVYREKVEMFQPGSEQNQLLASPWTFSQHGESGMTFSNALPHLPRVADHLCMVRSMHSEHNNHTEGLVMITSGKIFPGRPTLGSWVCYGLGTINQNLPAYVVLRDPKGYPSTGSTLWQNGWLPAIYRGTQVRTDGPPVLNLNPAQPLPAGARDDDLAFLAELNQGHLRNYPDNPQLESRIRNYELAARMQLEATAALDLTKETQQTRTLYGMDDEVTRGYGTRLLMARRMVEAGVRFVHVFLNGAPWDSHANVKDEIAKISTQTDRPTAGFIQDLAQRGLLEDTIVLWTGEFGRLPVSQNGKGRDHNRNGFTALLAGGGFRPGHIHGATDDVGYRATEDPVSVPDLFATILHQLGLDHDELTYHHHGRDETLTDSPVSGATVVEQLLT